MRNVRWESVGTALLVVAGCAIAASVVHREFFGRPPGLISIPAPSGPPEYVENWQELLSVGVLIGDTAAPVKVIEFADLECPFCRRFHAAYDSLGERYGNRVALVYVHFPLSSHRFAVPAARAAECARKQQRFGSYVRTIFEKQDSLGLKSWGSYAAEAGIPDTVALAVCATESTPLPQVEQGRMLGEAMDVRGTPTVLINGWRYPAAPVDNLSEIIAAFLETGSPPGVVAERQGS